MYGYVHVKVLQAEGLAHRSEIVTSHLDFRTASGGAFELLYVRVREPPAWTYNFTQDLEST